jgi:hypothetical protein
MDTLFLTLKDVIPDLFNRSWWAMELIFILIGLVRYYAFKNKRYGLGNKYVGVCLSIDTVLPLILIICDFPLWNIVWVIVPWLYFVVRYLVIRYQRNKCRKSTGDERAKKELEYLDWLLSLELMSWEVTTYLLDALGIMFKIGAIRSLNKNLKGLEDFKNHYKYKSLLSFVFDRSHNNQRMICILRDVLEDKQLPNKDRRCTINNLYHAYMVANDKEGQDSLIPMMEEEAHREGAARIELLEALFCRYEQEGDKDKLEELIKIIKSLKVCTFEQYTQLIDILYLYYKRIGNITENIALLDSLGEKAVDMNVKEEDFMIGSLRMVRLYMDLNYRWEEITIDLFRQAEFYLSYSSKVAFEYMEMTLYTLDNAQLLYDRNLDGCLSSLLLPNIKKYVDKYILEFKNVYTNEDNRFLYLKLKQIRSLLVYYRLQAILDKQYMLYGDNLERLNNRAVQLCQENENISELMHSLTTAVDESINFERCVNEVIALNNNDSDMHKVQQKLPTYRDSAQKNLKMLCNMLESFNYDKASGYYILWAAYFQNYYGKREDAGILFDRFEQQQISVKNYTLPVQRMYSELQGSLCKSGH